MLKILVTGGTGYIGKMLVGKLVAQGHAVVVLTRLIPDVSAQIAGVVYAQADISNPDEDFGRIVKGCLLVFHCAGEINVEARMRALHVDGFQRLLNACGALVQNSDASLHWVQLSSVGAYGSPSGATLPRVVTEDTVLAPVGEYERTKAEADIRLMASNFGGRFSYTILRPSIVFGRNMPNGSVRQWAAMVKRGLFFYIGKRGAVSTYVHVDDVVDALIECGFDPAAKGQIFNLSNDCSQEAFVDGLAAAQGVKAPTLRMPEWVARALALVGSPLKGFPLKMSRVDALVSRTRYPADKLFNVLGFKPKRDVVSKLNEVVAYDDAPPARLGQ